MTDDSSKRYLDRAWLAVSRVDGEIDLISPDRRSLAPGSLRARTLMDVSRHHLTDEAWFDSSLVGGLARIGEAQVKAFPGNLFWDFDAFAASMKRQALRSPEPRDFLDEVIGLACHLMSLFGSGSPIRFRYVHDFMYGYDWARWVKRDPVARRAVGPFDLPFLRYVARRGHEMIGLIRRDDSQYGRLDDDVHRNPFRFSRDPIDEQRLLEDLAARDLVPVKAWQDDGDARWNAPYEDLREVRARAIGIATSGQP